MNLDIARPPPDWLRGHTRRSRYRFSIMIAGPRNQIRVKRTVHFVAAPPLRSVREVRCEPHGTGRNGSRHRPFLYGIFISSASDPARFFTPTAAPDGNFDRS